MNQHFNIERDATAKTVSPTPAADWLETAMIELRRHQDAITASLEYAPGITHTFDDIVYGVMITNKYKFWSYEKSYLVTEVAQYPRTKNLHIFIGGGDLEEIISKHDEINAYAKEHGCNKMTIGGRPGWTRALKAHGWTPCLVTLARDIDYG